MSPEQEAFLKGVKVEKKSFLTGYFVAGDPDINKCVELIKEAVAAGLDAVEIGIPSEDPFLEGDVIKRAHHRSIRHFRNRSDYVAFFKRLRNEIDIPIWAMGYSKDIISNGLYKMLMAERCIDALVIPDLTLNEVEALKITLNDTGVQLIPVINNDMNESALKKTVENCHVIYCQIYQGKTGSEIKDLTGLPLFQQKTRSLTDAVLMAGFGVKTPQLAKLVLESGFDGVVVGSEIVRVVEQEDDNLGHFIASLAAAKTEVRT